VSPSYCNKTGEGGWKSKQKRKRLLMKGQSDRTQYGPVQLIEFGEEKKEKGQNQHGFRKGEGYAEKKPGSRLEVDLNLRKGGQMLWRWGAERTGSKLCYWEGSSWGLGDEGIAGGGQPNSLKREHSSF